MQEVSTSKTFIPTTPQSSSEKTIKEKAKDKDYLLNINGTDIYGEFSQL